MAFGRYFDEFEIGQVFRHWPRKDHFGGGRHVVLAANDEPAPCSHRRETTLRGTQHGQRLVVGPLVFSIVVGMSVADISGRAIANLDYTEVKHVGPVFPATRSMPKAESRTCASPGRNQTAG